MEIKRVILTLLFSNLLLLSFLSIISSTKTFAASIGIYTGSFDPPTIAHFEIIRQIAKMKEIDQVFVLVNRDGGKDFNLSLKDRLQLVKVVENGQNGKIITLPAPLGNKEQFAKKLIEIFHKDTKDIINFVGEDVFSLYREQMTKDRERVWCIVPREEPILSELSRTVGVARPIVEDKNIKFLKLDLKSQEIIKGVSSSQFRENMIRGEFSKAKDLLDPTVAKLIEENGFYRMTNNKSELQKKREAYLKSFELFKKSIEKLMEQKILANFKLDTFVVPEFKEMQHPSAWNDKFCRWIINSANLSTDAATTVISKLSNIADPTIDLNLWTEEVNYLRMLNETGTGTGTGTGSVREKCDETINFIKLQEEEDTKGCQYVHLMTTSEGLILRNRISWDQRSDLLVVLATNIFACKIRCRNSKFCYSIVPTI
ncbi:MAG: hypothetical protein HQK49_16845 [Oligoflexia bacterium]|nr:hypothetical protein [Oligoflexia bacterium]